MKTLRNLVAIAVIIFSQVALRAQNYPADPSLSQIISDIKSDPSTKTLMTSYGYDPSHIDKGTFRFAEKSELKDHYYVKWYWRSDYAYLVSMNSNYMDQRSFSIFLTTPKDETGVSHKIYFKVTYNRRTPQDFQDNKWNYEWSVLDPRENESYGIPKLTDEERKKIMVNYIEANKEIDENLKREGSPIQKIIKIDSVLAFSHSVRYFKPLTATTYLWTLTIRGEYIDNVDGDGGVKRIGAGYIRIPMEVAYKAGKFSVNSVYYDGDWWDSWAPGYQAMYDADLTGSKDFEDPVWFETLYSKGFDALMGKSIQKKQPIGSKAFLTKRLEEMKEALMSMNSQNNDEIREKLMPIMNPKRAKELTESYIAMLDDLKRKMCTIKVYSPSASIPYSFEMGDSSGPTIDFTMGIDRESARDKSLKAKYKAAGMSGAVLKSTARGSEYGLVQNKTYRTTFKVMLMETNWFIDEMADMEKAKVPF